MIAQVHTNLSFAECFDYFYNALQNHRAYQQAKCEYLYQWTPDSYQVVGIEDEPPVNPPINSAALADGDEF